SANRSSLLAGSKLNFGDVMIYVILNKETLINRRSREVVGDVGGEWPDTEAKRRPFGEVCPEDAPYFSHFSHA
ncbi:hypothetical protein, partial [Burkholderia ubonensis]|uniref:hypothetical protein n=1 Tax=Burkholderia ubonensis TaxID=101571 RepID=UPI001E599B32